MAKITFPKRFDEQEAKNGVWFDVYDQHDNFYGSYQCRLYDEHSAITKLMVERYNRTHRKETTGKGFTSEQRGVHFFVHTILMDWKLKDDDGKDVPFTTETAFEVLSQEDAGFVVDFLFKCARDTSNFRKEDDAEETKAKVAKN